MISMVAILYYLLKVSISLALVFLFYQLVLRRLTFYNWNRWFLLGYSVLSFIIPFFNISPVLEKNEWSGSQVINWVPVVHTQSVTDIAGSESSLSFFDIAGLLLLSGMLLMFFRLLLQLLSFRKMMKKAACISDQGMKVYEVNDPIIPFSFGNSIFINRLQHTEAELQEIIRHEFVHIRQRHSIDMLWTELLCLLNWFNPFAWLLKKAIRQNLEFIADQEVLGYGIPKKEYQYLLLKVTGNNQYSIATPFNFSSLKKRIAMMNKLQSARVHLVRFLFILPLLAVLLLAFRSQWKSPLATEKEPGVFAKFASIVYDKSSGTPLKAVKVTDVNSGISALSDDNGYFEMQFDIAGKREIRFRLEKEGYSIFESTHVFDDRFTKKSIGIVSLWEMRKGNSNQPCTDCPPLSVLNFAGNAFLGEKEARSAFQQRLRGELETNNSDLMISGKIPVSDTIPGSAAVNDLNEKGYQISITDTKGNCTVVVKDRNNKVVKKILLTEWAQKENYYEELYGALPPPPPPPPPAGTIRVIEDRPLAPAAPGTPVMGVILEERPIPPAPPAPAVPVKLPDHVKSINIQNDKAVVQLKNGNTETYLFSDPARQKAFEKKYGKVPEPPPPAPAKKVQGSRIYEVQPDQSLNTEKRAAVRGVNLGSDKISGQVVYLVDGKRTSPEEVNKIAPAAISSVNVIKDQQVRQTYGEAGKDGLIVITTKAAEEARKNVLVEVKGMDLNRTDASLNGPGTGVNTALSKTTESAPLYIYDGKEISKAEMNKIATNNIESVHVLKDKDATDLYGAKGKNGVVIITPKKK